MRDAGVWEIGSFGLRLTSEVERLFRTLIVRSTARQVASFGTTLSKFLLPFKVQVTVLVGLGVVEARLLSFSLFDDFGVSFIVPSMAILPGDLHLGPAALFDVDTHKRVPCGAVDSTSRPAMIFPRDAVTRIMSPSAALAESATTIRTSAMAKPTNCRAAAILKPAIPRLEQVNRWLVMAYWSHSTRKR
jgi:hypothetical protein